MNIELLVRIVNCRSGSIRGGEKWSTKGSYITYKTTTTYDWAFSIMVF